MPSVPTPLVRRDPIVTWVQGPRDRAVCLALRRLCCALDGMGSMVIVSSSLTVARAAAARLAEATTAPTSGEVGAIL
ncbi:MAG: hypothetical protein K0Q93_3187 [Nocardioidaceae bacterium]|jgi:hypothetical protein|nr:hypothetical protein [Nocardioidaceae bacterium]